MKNKKLFLGILVGLSIFGIAAMKYGAMDVWGLLKVDAIQHLNNAYGVYVEDVQFLSGVIGATTDRPDIYAGDLNVNGSISGIKIGLPIYINMLTKVPDAVGQGTWDRIVSNTSLYCGGFRNTPAAADGDNFTVNFSVPEGTYRIDFNAVKSTNMGILDVYVDTTKVLSATDLYAASVDPLNIVSITGISITTAGQHTLKFQINGKNASSSSYVLFISGIQISRTGD